MSAVIMTTMTYIRSIETYGMSNIWNIGDT